MPELNFDEGRLVEEVLTASNVDDHVKSEQGMMQAVALAGAITTLDSDTSVKPEAVDPKATLMTALTD